MAKLIIIGHLERAEELNQGFLFGYTFSVGWSERDRPNIDTSGPHPLLPWSWKTIKKICLFGKVSSSDKWEAIKAFDVIGDNAPVKIDAIKTEAAIRYLAASSIDWPDPSSDAPIVKLDVTQDGKHPLDPWSAHVIEMSGFPFPLAQRLNLSFAFRADQDLTKYAAFAAAPVLARNLNLDDELPLRSFQTAARTTDGYATYDQGTGTLAFDIVAASNIINRGVTSVFKGNGIGVLSVHLADWQQEFLLGASRLFSVPDFVQFVLLPPQDAKTDSPKAPADTILPTLIAAGVACLRDIVSPGLDEGPLGGFPRVRQLLSQNPSVLQEVKDSGYNKSFAEMKKWAGFLKENLPGMSQLSIWDILARDQSSDNQAISEPRLYYGQIKRDFLTVLAPIANDANLTGRKPTYPPNHQGVMNALWNVILDNLTASPQSQISSVKAGLPSRLEDISYSSLWRDDTLGMFWKNVLDNSNSSPNPFLARTLVLSKYFVLSRLGLPISQEETPASLPSIWRGIPTDWRPQNSQLTAWNNSKSVLLQWIKYWQDSVSASFQPGDVVPDQNSRNPPPVHIQYASFDKDNDVGNDIDTSQSDLFRDIRGIGLLVKEQDAQQWTPVNLNAAVDLHWEQCVATPVGFAIRSGYIAKLRRGLIPYEGEPLSGGTALDNIEGIQRSLVSALKVQRSPLVLADYHPEIHTPQLKYGRVFWFATFPELNSAILPSVIRKKTNPATDEPRAWGSSCGVIPKEWTTGNRLYQRTTRIGALRIIREDAVPNQPAVLPSIPVGTYPRARDIAWAQHWPAGAVKPVDQENLNLVLLSPDSWTKESSVPKSSYRFRVRLPEVTWREWSAWGASLPSRNAAGLPDPSEPVIPLDPKVFKAQRAVIIQECYETSLRNKSMPAVDDPSLSRLLYLELLEEAGGKLVLKDKQFLPITNLLGNQGRALYQSTGALITCTHNGGSVSSLSLQSSQAIAYVQEGKVAILRIWACLPIEYQRQGKNKAGQTFDKMFAPDILPAEKHPDIKYNNKDFLLVSPYDLLIEAASASLPAPAVLFDAFRASLRLKQSDTSVANVVASLPNLPTGTSVPQDQIQQFLNVGGVKAQRQTWRWEGRPVPLHPSLLESSTANQFDDLDRRWIWDVYPERPDVESVPILMPVRRTTPVSLGVFDPLIASGCRYFESEDSLSSASGPSQPQLDLRGAHFRFSLQVTSRYESLMNLAGLTPSRFAHPDLSATPMDSPKSLAWKSAYVPSRVNTPSVPKLRLLLPLTEAYDQEQSKSSALLAVFDDVFYDEVGLGDTLEAEIECVPDESSNPKLFVVQAGKDIQLRNSSEPALLPRYENVDQPPLKIVLDATHPSTKWSGPIGNYRDFNNRYARFLASSFIIPAPVRTDGTEFDVRGWLASIRFRRTVRTKDFPSTVANSTAFKDYTGQDLLGWKPRTHPSSWTESYWVQFLGSFSKFDGFDYRVANLTPLIDDSGVLTFHAKDIPEPVTLLPTDVPNFPDSRRLYAVVTQRVFDFRGQYNQELYVATLQQDKSHQKNWRAVSPSRIAALRQLKSDFRVRVVEVAFPTAGPRSNQQSADPENLFQELFQFTRVKSQDVASISGKPVYSPLDATGSILRVSEPANSVGADGQIPVLCEIEERK